MTQRLSPDVYLLLSTGIIYSLPNTQKLFLDFFPELIHWNNDMVNENNISAKYLQPHFVIIDTIYQRISGTEQMPNYVNKT